MKGYLIYTFLYFLLGTLLSCADAQNKADIEDLQPQQFQELVQSQQGVLLDVRTLEEYAEGHISHSKNIDYKNSNFESELKNLEKDKPYFVYCKSGVRSSKAGEMMQELGFTKVYLLDGGIEAWKEAGLPVESE